MRKKEEIRQKLRSVIDPDLDKDIVTLDAVQHISIAEEKGIVSFTLASTTPDDPNRERLKTECEQAVASLPWVKAVKIRLAAPPPTPPPRQSGISAQAPCLRGVRHLLAISSCKGGVGKSTIAANLAFALARTGVRTGIFDADVYGPSLPTIVRLEHTDLYQSNDMILPLEYQGIKLMSFGYIQQGPGSGAAIMRGPMVTQVINQLLTGTQWGELDYLIIDMPPGTGDIQLTLTQLIPLTAAVIVTTPQDLSFIDVTKGLHMFDKLKVPTVAVVENMSYFVCDQCEKEHYPFGQGARKKLVEQFGFKNTYEIPIQRDISLLSDAGTPLILEKPDSRIAQYFNEIADAVAQEIDNIQVGNLQKADVSFTPEKGIVIQQPSGAEKTISPAALRRACRCALCIEEMTGKPILDPQSVAEDIYPTNITPMGNYAVAVTWSDGHSSSIYPYEALMEME